MPSLVRQPRARIAAEWALRLLALGLLAWTLWRLLRATDATVVSRQTAEGADVRAALERWTADPEVRELRVRLDSLPDATTRDWLAALGQSGRRVEWSAGDAAPVAVAVEAVAAPGGGARVRVAGRAAAAQLADAGGVLDTLATAQAPATLTIAGLSAPVLARAPGAVARSRVPAPPRLGRVLVLGRAGWEAKFVVAALEEAGWTVDARIPLAPGVVVRQGSAAAPDTAHDAAVVALDSSALTFAGPSASSSGRALAAYVRSGGGLVLAGEAASLPAFSALAAGVATAPEPGLAGALATAAPRRALTLRPIARPRADAVIVERRGAQVAAAARRVGTGRVLQIGYDDSWRWRMEGDDEAAAAHRAWWSAVVASVAYAPATVDSMPVLDGAPYAHALRALGPPSASHEPAVEKRGAPAEPLRLWILLLTAAALLAEWASRRLRGAR